MPHSLKRFSRPDQHKKISNSNNHTRLVLEMCLCICDAAAHVITPWLWVPPSQATGGVKKSIAQRIGLQQ